MYIRCAFFQGHVKPGMKTAFDTHIQTTLRALWAQFPQAEEVRLLREVESDRPDTHLELVIMMRFPDRAALDGALASDVRYASRAASQPLLDMFDGHVFHTVFDADALALPANPGQPEPDTSGVRS
ncbi:hypothetical protein [Natronohydrobacter thiooxidans]|jgi:hypothetical protein|uniref:hypothetical protein n=1 Tax=Natronohydrobacter thiooxidans TaxID=87172 RepID=UPI0008FF67A4|nr:hypothetical protein [Natronohydrobacter thiooxidans]